MRRLRALSAMAGYLVSMALMALTALALIPALIRAGGSVAWGAIAAGQAVGAIGAVLLSYGWSLSGPAAVASGSAQQRREEFVASLQVKAALIAPVAVVSGAVAALVVRDHWSLAVLGAAQALLAGLSANWFFVGLRRPWTFLAVETVPRVLGSLLAIVVMSRGAGPVVGLACQIGGMLVAFLVGLVWIMAEVSRRGAVAAARRPVRQVLAEHRHGVTSVLGSTSYAAAPVVLVALVAPAAQPLYALVDKLQRQVNVGLSPAVSVLQGWVPTDGQARQRSPRAVAIGAVAAVLAAVAMIVLAPWLNRWLGAGQVHVPTPLVILTGCFVGISLFDSVVAKAVLPALKQLRVVSRATLICAAVGLPLVLLGGWQWGAVGALSAVVFGVVLRVGIELVALRRILA